MKYVSLGTLYRIYLNGTYIRARFESADAEQSALFSALSNFERLLCMYV